MPDLNRNRINVALAPQSNSVHWNQDTVKWSDICGWVEKPASSKKCGNYILATLVETEKVHAGSTKPCTGIHRDSRSVAKRSQVLALDIDEPDPNEDFPLTVAVELSGIAYVWHTTYSSTPRAPRYRLLVLADREMAPDEYVAATTALAARMGLEQFDKGSFQATRYMFKPAARKKSWYSYHVEEGEPVVVADLLKEFKTDLSKEEMPEPSRFKRDPFELADPIGAFNRVYTDWDDLIEAYDLPYEKVGDEDRYHLKGAVSEAGMGPIPGAPGLVFSHHVSDPAADRACSAFDLVRLHWYADMDEGIKPGTPVNRMPSHLQMCETASQDPRVVEEIFSGMTSDFQTEVVDEDGMEIEVEEDPDDPSWRAKLGVSGSGRFQETVQNFDLLRKHDPVLRNLYYNVMNMVQEVDKDLPWRKVTATTKSWDVVDTEEFRFYLERTYHFRAAKERAESLVITAAGQNRRHPIQDYLLSLEWDGKQRVEKCLPGTEDTPYNRLVARKVLVGAVARAMEPGVKWDHTLILFGPQGVGKSTWVERMASVGFPERRSFMYSLGDIRSKDTLMAMNMSWLVLSDEGHTLRKAENDTLKEFLTRNSDVYRIPYERSTQLHPRQCVIWSTTNDETILRRQEGNRRFLIVKCVNKYNLDQMTDEYVDQLWAEAYTMYIMGEKLYLNEDEFRAAEKEQVPFLEEDTTAGVLSEFLDQKVPEDWWDMSPEERQQWVIDKNSGFEQPGTMQVNQTCTRQLWVEALGQKLLPRRGDLLEIGSSLRELGWKSTGHRRFPGYGVQTVFERPEGFDLI